MNNATPSFRDLDQARFSDEKRKDLIARLESKAIWEPNTGCLIWTGCVNHAGYGQYGVKLAPKRWKIMQAHRLSYWLHVGTERDGQVIMHRCDMPPCINPGHLTSGTQAANIRDMNVKGRRADTKGELCPGVKLTDEIVRLIRSHPGTGVELARRFNVTPALITNIRKNLIWKHIT